MQWRGERSEIEAECACSDPHRGPRQSRERPGSRAASRAASLTAGLRSAFSCTRAPFRDSRVWRREAHAPRPCGIAGVQRFEQSWQMLAPAAAPTPTPCTAREARHARACPGVSGTASASGCCLPGPPALQHCREQGAWGLDRRMCYWRSRLRQASNAAMDRGPPVERDHTGTRH